LFGKYRNERPSRYYINIESHLKGRLLAFIRKKKRFNNRNGLHWWKSCSFVIEPETWTQGAENAQLGSQRRRSRSCGVVKVRDAYSQKRRMRSATRRFGLRAIRACFACKQWDVTRLCHSNCTLHSANKHREIPLLTGEHFEVTGSRGWECERARITARIVSKIAPQIGDTQELIARLKPLFQLRLYQIKNKEDHILKVDWKKWIMLRLNSTSRRRGGRSNSGARHKKSTNFILKKLIITDSIIQK